MNPLKLMTSLMLLLSVSGMVSAESASNPDKITDLLKSRLGGVAVEAPTETPVEGVYQTRFGTKFAYLTGNGRYVFIGDMIDLESQVNLTELSRRGLAKETLKQIPVKDLVVYPAKDETKTVLSIFTDTSCPYCQKLHEEVPELQKAGIEVRYFPFPRGGNRGPGYDALKQVWCGKDRNQTMDIAKKVKSGDLPGSDCEAASIVDQGYVIGNQVGITGTPALFTESGQKLDGYVPYKQLIPMLLGGS
ncbi:MAG: DsbC family protein [Gammaproteobacteria bacterium]|nr:DsbC family protein [Gammaproteobacteria bacterium]